MPKVFLINEPLRKDDATGELIRFLPIERAADHGEIIRLTPDGSPPGNLAPWLRMIDKGLEAWEDGDFVVLVGDQSLLAYASSVIGAHIADRLADTTDGGICGTLRALKWSRHKNAYEPVALGFDLEFAAESV